MLPKIENELSTHLITLPSGKNVNVRKWKVKDKKEFLFKLDKNASKELLRDVLIQIIKSCILDPNVDEKFNSLSKVDVVYLFTELRKLSEGDTIDFSFTCGSCQTLNEDVTINLSDCLKITNFKDTTISLNNGMIFTIKEIPYLKQIQIENTNKDNQIENTLDLMANSIKSFVYENIPYENFTIEEIKELIQNLDIPDFEKLLTDITENIGSVFLVAKAVCKNCQKENAIPLGELEDFFQ